MLTTLIILKNKHCAKRKNRMKGLGGALPKKPYTTRNNNKFKLSRLLWFLKPIKANVLLAKHTSHGVHVKSQQ